MLRAAKDINQEDTGYDMRYRINKFHSGFTLMELTIAMAINLTLILAAGVLFVNGNRIWQRTFESTQKSINMDALAVTTAFGSIGRKANRLNYIIYERSGDTFTPAEPQTSNPEEVVSGDAVEFRYWDVELDETDSHDLMDSAKTATAYALFYLSGDNLLVDYGPYPPGAIPDGGGTRNTTGVITRILAENVSVDQTYQAGPFSHTVVNGVGHGSVRINITLTDPNDNETTRVVTATLMRNIWPR
jgi:prepilin-type N-terminal cleavage/methylation domain-containing protein